MNDLEARCRNCGNSGVDMFGKPCVCRYGRALPGLLDTIRNLRTNGTPEGIASAIGRAGAAQLAAHVAAGGAVPPTIDEMEQAMERRLIDLSKLKMNMTSYVPLHQAHELAVRQNELYEAIQIVESCGASPELTEAVVKLGDRLHHIQLDLVSAVKEAAFWWE